MDQNSLISVEQYFIISGHNFNRDVKLTTIDRIENDVNLKSITKKKKHDQVEEWIKRLISCTILF